MKTAIKKLNLELILLCLTFFEPTAVPHYAFLTYKYVILLFVFIKYCVNIVSEKRLFVCIFLYGGVTLLSTIVNRMAINTVVASFFYMLQIIDIFIFLRAYFKQCEIKELVKYVTLVFLSLCILTDALMLFVTYDFNNSSEKYFIGSKFAVSYLHAFTLVTLFALTNYEKPKLNFGIVTFAVLSLCVCTKITCATGQVVNIVVLVLLISPKSVRRFAMSGKAMILLTAVMNFLIFGSFSLLTIPAVQNVVTTVLHRSSNLTGRLPIYSILLSKIYDSFFIGYGYYNNVIGGILNYGNAQNGVMKILMDSGFLGLIGYIGIVYLGLNRRGKELDFQWPWFAFLYAMVIGSSVEINLTYMTVFFAIAVVFTNNEKLLKAEVDSLAD